MSKNKIIVLASVIVLVLSVAISAYIWFRPGRETKKPEAPSEATKGGIFLKEDATPDVLYEDAVVGFSMNHPESITIEDITPEDEVHYALLNLNSGSEKVEIIFKDTDYGDLEELLNAGEEIPVSAELVGAAALDKVSVNQYSYSLDGQEMLATAGIDKGVLYLIKGPNDGGFWEETQSVIVSTFAFAQKEASSASSGGPAVIYEAEEVIE